MRKAKEILQELTSSEVSFASALKAYRARHDLTQKELADKLKVSKSHVGDLETGRKLISVERSIKFAKILKESEKYFITFSLRDQVVKSGYDYIVKLSDNEEDEQDVA